MSIWHPISTVPRGVDVLVYCPDAREPQVIIAALLAFDDGKGGELHEWHDVWFETNLDCEPTHWAKLPRHPGEANGRG